MSQAANLTTERREDILADIHLTLLRIVYPDYRFTADLRRAGGCH